METVKVSIYRKRGGKFYRTDAFGYQGTWRPDASEAAASLTKHYVGARIVADGTPFDVVPVASNLGGAYGAKRVYGWREPKNRQIVSI